jgi:predicted DNA-binding protein
MTQEPATSFRLPDHTRQQLEWLAHTLGMTMTQVLTIALDRMHREIMKEKMPPVMDGETPFEAHEKAKRRK